MRSYLLVFFTHVLTLHLLASASALASAAKAPFLLDQDSVCESPCDSEAFELEAMGLDSSALPARQSPLVFEFVSNQNKVYCDAVSLRQLSSRAPPVA